jgi:acetoin utilization deacetylase AcuC-like enzyme
LYGALGAAGLLTAPGFFNRGDVRRTCLLYDPIYLNHLTGERHAEKPERLTAVLNKAKQLPFYQELLQMDATEAGLDMVALVHQRDYIEKVEKECRSGSTRLSTGDTVISKDSYEVALNAVGGVLGAVDSVLDGKAKNAFCAVRPPGHHATPTRGMGFCIFNNVAIAARFAQSKHGVERVLIADWDVHHGNGTQDTFYRDGSVFFMSTHQSPLYPGTGKIEEIGEGNGKGYTMNRPFPPGAGNKEIVGAFKNDLLPAARDFKPDLTLISAGFDSRVGDRLGKFEVDDQGFRELTRIMLEIAHISGNGRLVSVLEGGYTLEGLASAAAVHLEELSKA